MKTVCLLTNLSLAWASAAWSASFCSSDGQARPVALLERFISADCQACWSERPSGRLGRHELAVDWIVPSAEGDAAPLSAAASPDAPARLERLGQPQTRASSISRRPVHGGPVPLRVGHGPAVNDYIAALIEARPPSAGTWTAWLLLVESLPAGTEGSPVERHLVRNALISSWTALPSPTGLRPAPWKESRPMQIPQGASPPRLRVIGWVEDAQGRIRSLAQSRCAPTARP